MTHITKGCLRRVDAKWSPTPRLERTEVISMVHWWWLLGAFWFGISLGVAFYAAILYKVGSTDSAVDFIPTEEWGTKVS